jgi:hypothetical protein
MDAREEITSEQATRLRQIVDELIEIENVRRRQRHQRWNHPDAAAG